MTGEAKQHKAQCARCGGIRNCDILTQYDERGEEAPHFYWNTTWSLLQCRGCENIFVQTVSTNSEEYDDYYDQDGEVATNYHETIRYWPALSKRKRPEWISDAGIDADNVEPLSKSLSELYGALDNDLYMLAAIGLRTSFDVAAELLKIDPNETFKNKLLALKTGGHIGETAYNSLGVLVSAGSASAHRGWCPEAKDLDVLMDVLEHFIYDVFVAPYRRKKMDIGVKQIEAKVPIKKGTAKKK